MVSCVGGSKSPRVHMDGGMWGVVVGIFLVAGLRVCLAWFPGSLGFPLERFGSVFGFLLFR